MANLDIYTLSQQSVIGSMLIDDRCVPLVISKLTEDDFMDPTCRNFFRAIRELAREGRPVDPVTAMGKLKAEGDYVQWCAEVMEITPTAANVESYIPEVLEGARIRRFRALCEQGMRCADTEAAAELVRKMSSSLSATERMPRMTGPELARNFLDRMGSKEKPKYLPWGIPTADRHTYAELGDMILLGGYASSGKTLLSILMAMAQAKAGYKVGYYSLETKPEKMADRIFSSLSKVPLGKIKKREIGEDDWPRFTKSANYFATECPFDIIQASESTVDDITADAIGHGYQIIYVDYVQQLQVSGKREKDDRSRVAAVSQSLKGFGQSTSTAVVALAQLTRPQGVEQQGKKKDPPPKPAMPTMHAFKESGQLEQDADAAFLVFLSDPRDNNSTRLFRIAKNKEGARPEPVELAFYGDTQTMVELEPAPDHSVAAELAARGRAVKQANRARAQQANRDRAQQAEFRELPGGEDDIPF